MDEELLVVTEAVEGIEDGEVFCLVCVERRGKNDAVGNAAGKNFAGNGVAFDASGGGEEREVKEVEEIKDEEESAPALGVRAADFNSAKGMRSSLPGESRTARSMRFSNSRTLPGQE